MSDLRDRIARVLFVDATAGTGYLWDGTERQEVAHREAAYSLADVICGFIAEDRRELVDIATEVAKEYEDAADWTDAIGRLQKMARAALAKEEGK
jgi:hypothetical protein